MKVRLWMACYAIAAFLLVIGLVVTLAAPGAGVLILLVGGLHYLVGYLLRERQHRRLNRQRS